MGEIADAIVDRMIFGSPQRTRRKTYQSRSGNYRWRTASGEVVSMYDMTPRHLRNALNVCEENGNSGKAKQLRRVMHDREIPHD